MKRDTQHNDTQHNTLDTDCCYAKCQLCSTSFMLSAEITPFMPSVAMLNVVMLSAAITTFMLSVVMLNAVMLSAVAPFKHPIKLCFGIIFIPSIV
jgi:hypothetical protein